MAASKKSRKPFQTVKSGNVSIPIYRGHVRGENGKTYNAFTVAGYIGEQRRRWTFGALNDAVAKAKELADSIANGQAELLGWPRSFRLEVVEAIKLASEAGVGLLAGIKLLSRALQILGNADELLFACRVRKDQLPSKNIITRSVENAVEDFLTRQKSRLSANPRRRQRN